jgi:hypothetical protein
MGGSMRFLYRGLSSAADQRDDVAAETVRGEIKLAAMKKVLAHGVPL